MFSKHQVYVAFFCCKSIKLVQLLNKGLKVNYLEDFGHFGFPDKIFFMVLQLFYFIKYGKKVEYRAFNLNFFGHCNR